jgi:hypothetical protein
MEAGRLQRPLAEIIAQRGAGHAQKQRQLVPVVLQVGDRLTESRIGLHGVCLELGGHPVLQRLHPRATLLLVQESARGRRESLLLGPLVGVEHGAQGLQHQGDLIGKGVMDLDELPSPMRNAGGGLRGMRSGGIARQGIGHLDRGRRTVLALVEDGSQVLPGMAGPGFEQDDRAVDGLGHHPGGEDPGALGVGPRGQGFGARRSRELEDAHGGVVVVEHRALGRLLSQFLERGGEAGRCGGDDVPLGGGRPRDG